MSTIYESVYRYDWVPLNFLQVLGATGKNRYRWSDGGHVDREANEIDGIPDHRQVLKWKCCVLKWTEIPGIDLLLETSHGFSLLAHLCSLTGHLHSTRTLETSALPISQFIVVWANQNISCTFDRFAEVVLSLTWYQAKSWFIACGCGAYSNVIWWKGYMNKMLLWVLRSG